MKSPDPIRVGELRPTQSLYTFGIGAIVDLPKIAVIVMGLDDWKADEAKELEEPRLLRAVQEVAGKQVQSLRQAPLPPEGEPDDHYSAKGMLVGMPVAVFPRWLRCPLCGRLAPLASPVFRFLGDKYRFDRSRFVHHICQKSTGSGAPDAVPARFMVACDKGHLDDFPWVYFVHGGKRCPGGNPILEISERGSTGEATDIFIGCKTCGTRRPMAQAFGHQAGLGLPRCRGRRPHLRDVDEEGCGLQVRALTLGASNSWFGVTRSALSIPASKDPLEDMVQTSWAKLSSIKSREQLDAIRSTPFFPAEFADFGSDALWKAMEARRTGDTGDDGNAGDLKTPEWKVFTSPADQWTGSDFRDFKLRRVEVPERFSSLIQDVVLVERLREVTALLGFTRLESYDGRASGGSGRAPAPLSRQPPTFLPAAEVRGEGFFIRFREEHIGRWCEENEDRLKAFEAAHREWREKRGIEMPSADFPGLRYIFLHTLSHALMRQVSLECGYSAASIRERIYAREPEEDDGPMAGILLYTAAPDSEGTLGGLVRLGEPESLHRQLVQALESARLCGSDPLCSEHVPVADGLTIHGAACHACMFAPETSCERSNRYLDRSLLVRTLDDTVRPFFHES